MTDKYVDTKILGSFDGTAEQWQDFDSNMDSFQDTLPDEYEKILRMKEPKTRDRVTRRYDAPEEDDEDYEGPDVTGALPGETVATETENQYKAKQRDYVKKVRKLFAWLKSAVTGGKAMEIAKEMAKEGTRDGKKLRTAWQKYYGEVTNAHAGHMFKELINMTKNQDKPIDQHTDKWNKDCASVETHLDWAQMKIILFLMSLGPTYRTFFDIVTTSTEKLDLHEVQKRAADYGRTHDNSDEGKPAQIAFSAHQQQQKQHRGTKRKRQEHELTSKEKQQRPCIQCGHPIHNWYGCFSGALDWMDAEQRRAHIETDRIKRGYYGGHHNQTNNHNNRQYQNTNNSNQQQEHTGTAALAELQKQHKEQMHVLEETLRSKHLHGIANELNDAGFNLDMS